MRKTKLLVVAARDARKRYRFVSQPLKMLSDVECVEITANGSSSGYVFKHIKQAWKNRDADLVIFVGGNLTAILWFFLCKIFIRKKYILRIGGDLVAPLISILRTKGYKSKKEFVLHCVNIGVNIILLNVVNGIIVVSHQLKKDVHKYAMRRVNVHVARQFVEVNNDVSHKVILNNRNVLNLLTVTNLKYVEKYRGIRFLLDALSRFIKDNAEGPKICLDVVGDGNYFLRLRNDLENYCNERLSITLHGFVKEVDPYYRSADIFLYCSTLDGLPNVLLEAMSFGLPMLVNSHPNFTDILSSEKNALFYDIGECDDFASSLKRLMYDGNLFQSMSLNNINKAIEEYSSWTVALSLERIISKYTYTRS